MADNYLERKMEDLRSGRRSDTMFTAKRPGVSVSGSRYDGLCVVIEGGSSPLGIQLAKDFKAKGASVDIIDSDWKLGQNAAQQSGSTFHLADLCDPLQTDRIKEQILAIRGHIDIYITLSA